MIRICGRLLFVHQIGQTEGLSSHYKTATFVQVLDLSATKLALRATAAVSNGIALPSGTGRHTVVGSTAAPAAGGTHVSHAAGGSDHEDQEVESPPQVPFGK